MAEGGATPLTPIFQGFGDEDNERHAELNNKLNVRKLKEMEGMIESLVERVCGLEAESVITRELKEKINTMERENERLRNEN